LLALGRSWPVRNFNRQKIDEHAEASSVKAVRAHTVLHGAAPASARCQKKGDIRFSPQEKEKEKGGSRERGENIHRLRRTCTSNVWSGFFALGARPRAQKARQAPKKPPKGEPIEESTNPLIAD